MRSTLNANSGRFRYLYGYVYKFLMYLTELEIRKNIFLILSKNSWSMNMLGNAQVDANMFEKVLK